jgi:hypothetical protein
MDRLSPIVKHAELERAGVEEQFQGAFPMGEPQMSYDRIDQRFAQLAGKDPLAFTLQREVETLIAKENVVTDADFLAAIQRRLSKMPSADRMSMMNDPGGWAYKFTVVRAAFEKLARESGLRVMALHQHGDISELLKHASLHHMREML